MKLPEPRTSSDRPLEAVIAERRSTRSYKNGPLTLNEVSQLLWAAQGITSPEKLRAAPSAGGTYPLNTYLVAGDVVGLEPGLYRYENQSNELSLVRSGDLREELSELALGQSCVKDAAAILIFTAVYERTTSVYGDRGTMYVHIDVGHAAENVLLQSTALGLGSVPVGAFRTRSVSAALQCQDGEVALYMVPAGRL
ncbi:MAG: SagB/ThcOx family dehydrogenase [Chloroflexota bacterium]